MNYFLLIVLLGFASEIKGLAHCMLVLLLLMACM